MISFSQEWVSQVPYNFSSCAHVGRALRGLELGISSFIYAERIQISRGSLTKFVKLDSIFGLFTRNILFYS